MTIAVDLGRKATKQTNKTVRYERIASSADPDNIPHPAVLIRVFIVLLGCHLMGAMICYANAHSMAFIILLLYFGERLYLLLCMIEYFSDR